MGSTNPTQALIPTAKSQTHPHPLQCQQQKRLRSGELCYRWVGIASPTSKGPGRELFLSGGRSPRGNPRARACSAPGRSGATQSRAQEPNDRSGNRSSVRASSHNPISQGGTDPEGLILHHTKHCSPPTHSSAALAPPRQPRCLHREHQHFSGAVAAGTGGGLGAPRFPRSASSIWLLQPRILPRPGTQQAGGS